MKANFNLNNMYIRHALRFTLAMTLGLAVVYLTHERSAIWITMGILIIIKPDVTSTVNNMISRVSFNFIAIILAIILGFIFPHQILV
nr:FUSC family protein [Methanobacterium formicicum]